MDLNSTDKNYSQELSIWRADRPTFRHAIRFVVYIKESIISRISEQPREVFF